MDRQKALPKQIFVRWCDQSMGHTFLIANSTAEETMVNLNAGAIRTVGIYERVQTKRFAVKVTTV